MDIKNSKMNRYNWNYIKAFLAVVDTGSLSAAAALTGISQPTLGRMISALETSLNVTLFSRGRMGMSPSKAGLTLVNDARLLSEQADQLAIKAHSRSSSAKGTVRITASIITSAYILPPVLKAFKAHEPDIDIELVASDKNQNLLSRDADIAIRMVPLHQNSLIGRKVNEMGIGTYVHQDYIDKNGQPETIDKLFEHTLLGLDREGYILQHMASLGIKGDRNMFAFRTDDQIAYWKLLSAGAGIGFCAHFLARKNTNLVPILPELKIPSLPMWIASHQELKTSLKIRLAMDFLFEAIKTMPLN